MKSKLNFYTSSAKVIAFTVFILPLWLGISLTLDVSQFEREVPFTDDIICAESLIEGMTTIWFVNDGKRVVPVGIKKIRKYLDSVNSCYLYSRGNDEPSFIVGIQFMEHCNIDKDYHRFITLTNGKKYRLNKTRSGELGDMLKICNPVCGYHCCKK